MRTAVIAAAIVVFLTAGVVAEDVIIGKGDRGRLYSLEQLLWDLEPRPFEDVPAVATDQLRSLGPEHRELLERFIRDERDGIARCAAEALVAIGDDEALRVVRGELGLAGRSSWLRYNLAMLLAEAGDTGALPLLRAMRDSGSSWPYGVDRGIEKLECPGAVLPLIYWSGDRFLFRFLVDDVEAIEFDGGATRSSVSFDPTEYRRILIAILSAERECVAAKGRRAGGLHIRLRSGREAVLCSGDTLFYYCPTTFAEEWDGMALRSEELADYISDAAGESSN